MKNMKQFKNEKRKAQDIEKPTRDITKRLLEYMKANYDMRFNTILGYTEMRPKNSEVAYQPVDERMRNTIAIHARLDGINVWDKDIKRYTDSQLIPSYNPLTRFIDGVRGMWDGYNHIEQLATCIPTSTTSWKEWFHTWFLGMVAQWMHLDTSHGNSVAPLLISPQGAGKSTFCKQILPPCLQWGYNDNLVIGEKRTTLLALSQYLLINIDEFNAVSPKVQEGFLKNVLQLADVKIKRPYGRHSITMPRLASFIGTANMADVLTDTSGSRRFIGISFEDPVRLPSTLDYTQLYAQAVEELEAGRRYWFNDEETEQIMEHNRTFRQQTPIEELFFAYFAIATNENKGTYMTAANIFTYLRQKVGGQLRVSGLNHFGRILTHIPNLRHRHTVRGTEYLVSML